MKTAEVKARPPAPSDPTIDGLTPEMVFEPDSVEAAARALALCSRESLAVVPVGAGTRLHVGNVPSRLDCYLSTAGLSGVTQYEPGDLTLSAFAGTPLARVQAVTGAERQFLPWDPPQSGRATLGGILAAGDPGFRKRPGARPRDLLLGFEALLPDGTLVKSGGKVVKNVAGFEVTKLLVGSLGTLAVLTRVHLRVRLRPEASLTQVALYETQAQVQDGVFRLRRAACDPEVLAVTNPTLSAALGLSGWSLLSRFEGFEEEVRSLSSRAREHLSGASCFEPREAESDSLWERLQDLPVPSPERGVIFRVHALPSKILSMGFDPADEVALYPDGGIGYVRAEDAERISDTAARIVLESGPPDLKRDVDVFGEPGKNARLMKRIKETFDPRGVLSPGRAAGKI